MGAQRSRLGSRVARFLHDTMRSVFRRIAGRDQEDLSRHLLDSMREMTRPSDAATQLVLKLEYRRLVEGGGPLPRLQETGFQVCSQADEDGILLYLFSVIGANSRRCVEICAGDGLECNTANLILNHGWHALLVDGNKDLVARGVGFYRQSKLTRVFPPRFVCSWVTRSNVNDLLRSNDFTGEVDLLSLDLDGVDYWIWEAIDAVSPRVVVLEYQDILGPDRACTVPYADDFDCTRYPTTEGMPNFCGASLSAFCKLGHRKGYRLVGVNRYGYNAFFVRNGIADRLLPEIDVKDCFSHPKVAWGMRERFPSVKDYPWVDV
jgi:hypothetical protein